MQSHTPLFSPLHGTFPATPLRCSAADVCGECEQVAHITGDVEFLDSTGGKVQRGWAAGQVATTADFSHGSWLWTQFSGGLNYQVPAPRCLYQTWKLPFMQTRSQHHLGLSDCLRETDEMCMRLLPWVIVRMEETSVGACMQIIMITELMLIERAALSWL